MCNNIYMRDKELETRLRERTQEMENYRKAALATGGHGAMRHFIGRCGTFLVMLGTYLEQAERHGVPARV